MKWMRRTKDVWSGVMPDLEVELDGDLLLQGIDSQLEVAIDHIQRQEAPVRLNPHNEITRHEAAKQKAN
jgi:hypothetical protein